MGRAKPLTMTSRYQVKKFLAKSHRFMRQNPQKMFLTSIPDERETIVHRGQKRQYWLRILGECDEKTNEIRIDWESEIIPVLVHELLHVFFPQWSETRVRKETREIQRSLTPRQALNLLKSFVAPKRREKGKASPPGR